MLQNHEVRSGRSAGKDRGSPVAREEVVLGIEHCRLPRQGDPHDLGAVVVHPAPAPPHQVVPPDHHAPEPRVVIVGVVDVLESGAAEIVP